MVFSASFSSFARSAQTIRGRSSAMDLYVKSKETFRYEQRGLHYSPSATLSCSLCSYLRKIISWVNCVKRTHLSAHNEINTRNTEVSFVATTNSRALRLSNSRTHS
jgi:hypothetical protein